MFHLLHWNYYVRSHVYLSRGVKLSFCFVTQLTVVLLQSKTMAAIYQWSATPSKLTASLTLQNETIGRCESIILGEAQTCPFIKGLMCICISRLDTFCINQSNITQLGSLVTVIIVVIVSLYLWDNRDVFLKFLTSEQSKHKYYPI